MSRERITVYMQTDDPRHLRVWNEIKRIPAGKRSEYVVQLVSQALDQQEIIYQAVKRAFHEYQPHIPAASQPPPTQTTNIEQVVEAGQIPDEMLGFIFALQEEGG